MKIDEIETNSEQLREILEKPNGAILNWGITIIFFIIISIFVLLWCIKYPDAIEGGVELTTMDPPIKLVNKNDSEIKEIYFNNNENVSKGELILESKNTMDGLLKIELEKIIGNIRLAIQNDQLSNFTLPNSDENYGVIQEEYSTLIVSIINYQNLTDPTNIPFRLVNLKEQLKNTRLLRKVNADQELIAQQGLGRSLESFKADKRLFEKGIISKKEFIEKENEYAMKQGEVKNLKKASIQYDVRITELKKEVNDTELEFKQNKKLLLGQINEQLATIDFSLTNWEQNFQIRAPFDGKLTYLGNLKKNQFLASGREVFSLSPDTREYVGLMKIPSAGYGKVKKGQMVRIKLDNYPYHEFGLLKGKVKDISLIANEDAYLVKVSLVSGLKSTYDKELMFTPEMGGSAEIITEELRLIDRIFNRIKQIFDN